MTPQAEHSPYHGQRPLPHDLPYHLEHGVPVLGDEELDDA